MILEITGTGEDITLTLRQAIKKWPADKGDPALEKRTYKNPQGLWGQTKYSLVTFSDWWTTEMNGKNVRVKYKKFTRSQVDRWLSKYGPDYPLYKVFMDIGWIKEEGSKVDKEVGENREKGKDDVAEASDNPQEDAEMHGGDGNSGEVDNEAETSSEEERECTISTPDELIEQLLNQEDEAGHKERKEKSIIKSVHDTFMNDKVDRKHISRLVERLKRVVEDEVGGKGGRSPRIDGNKLVTEMISKRWSLPRARRDEMNIKPVLIMVDISGSCSSSAGGNYKAAVMVQQQLPDKVQIVIHGNGFPDYSIGEHLPPFEEGCDHIEYYNQKKWSLVINFGDADANKELESIADNGSRVLVLDSRGSSSFGEAYLDFKDKNLVWVSGVNDVTDAWVGLKIYKDNI